MSAQRLRVHREEQQHRREQREQHAGPVGWDSRGFVFVNDVGGPIDPRRDLLDWRDLLQVAEVRQTRLHDARHTAATFLLLQGVDPRVVMDLMGWSTVSMLKRYQHVVDSLRREAATRMGAYLYGDPDAPP